MKSPVARGVATMIYIAMAIPLVAAQSQPFPEHYRFRQEMEDQILAPVDALYRLGPKTWTDGPEAHFETRFTSDAVYLIFSPGPGAATVERGTYVIKRSLPGGDFAQVKIFLQSDPEHFVRIYPDGLRSRLEVTLHGRIIYDRLILPVPFGQILTSPFRRIIDMTRDRVDWNLILPNTSDPGYARVANLVTSMRQRLPDLPDADDGAMDAEGNWVYIENMQIRQDGGFNCSGFAKWMIDGFYAPVTGHYLDIQELKEKHLELRGNSWTLPAEDARDPWFGLDWTRNLAVAWLRLESPSANEESADVNDLDFVDYVEDLGYRSEDLPFVAYQMAVKYPGDIFLGSVAKRYGENPVLTQHVHVLVLMPWLEPDGHLKVTVMERNFESGVKSLMERYPGDRIHFVRVRVPDRVDLSPVN